jgi:hypothetical protein
MLQLIKILWAICRLKAGPQELPSGRNILISAILAGIFIDSFATSIFMPEKSGLEVIILVAIYNVALLMAAYFLLRLVGYAERGVQTITAMAGSGLLISLVLLPSLLMINFADETVNSQAIFILFDNVWRIVVNAHIFRHALSVNLLLAMIISVSYLVFGVLVADILLPTQDGS